MSDGIEPLKVDTEVIKGFLNWLDISSVGEVELQLAYRVFTMTVMFPAMTGDDIAATFKRWGMYPDLEELN